MKNTIKSLAFAAVAVISLGTSGVTYAYNQAEYTANGKPQFNTYTDAANYGNEKDFLRVGPVGGRGSDFSNNLEVCSGEARLNVYIHNGSPESNNGTNNDGTGVAKDTKLNVKIPTTASKNVSTEAIITASNAGTVTDFATISCGTHDVKVEYVPGSATISSKHRAKAPLNDAVANGGTLVGTYADDGIVPGCWDFRQYVSLTVKITKVEKPVVPVTPVTPTTPVTSKPVAKPVVLPATGPANIAGVFAVTTAVGGVSHYIFAGRRKQ